MLYFKQVLEQFLKNPTKLYLISANMILVSFAIWFSNVGLLPFKNLGDFAFFAVLALILGIYRPGWTFVFFIGALALENVNLAPKELGLTLRPYQFFGLITLIALLIQIFSKRLAFELPKFNWYYDGLAIVFALAGFLSVMGAANRGVSLKQSVIALSFVTLYFLTRVYVQSFQDAERIVAFFLSSGLIVSIYAIWQNVRFLAEKNAFEVMPGRPNGTFTEADWLGIYLVFLFGIVLAMIYYFDRTLGDKQFISKFKIQNTILVKILLYVVYCILCIALILTVSRSAWVGAAFVVVVFLKFMLLGQYGESNVDRENKWQKFLLILKMQKWQWKKTGVQLLFLLIIFGFSLLAIKMIPLTNFQLANRAASTGGLQKITIACPGNQNIIPPPQKIGSVDELVNYHCRHIDLEDIAKEKALGNIIMEVERPDPNVNIRADIYRKSITQIKGNFIFGLGWGGISSILGSDERGAGLNASNIFLETWLGGGLLGVLSIVLLFGGILVSLINLFLSNEKNATAIAFVGLGWAAIMIPNLFNAGIFLGFLWVYLAIAVGLLSEKYQKDTIQ